MGTVLYFPTFISHEESRFGFSITPSPTGGHAAVAQLREGLFAVKARGRDGSVIYRVCNRAHAELYPMAVSLEELRARFAPEAHRPCSG